jgi:hypothetical protein
MDRAAAPGDGLVNDIRQTYYRMAEHFLNDYTFPSSEYRFIWKHHSEGLSYREIVKLMNTNPGTHATKWKVNEVIKHLVATMKLLYKDR